MSKVRGQAGLLVVAVVIALLVVRCGGGGDDDAGGSDVDTTEPRPALGYLGSGGPEAAMATFRAALGDGLKVREAAFYADYVIIAGVYNTSKASELGKVLDVGELVKDIEMQGKPAHSFPDADAIVEHLSPEFTDGDVVAIMSNGGFGGIHDKILEVLRG